MNKVYLLIGGNTGQRQQNLVLASQYISDSVGRLLQASAFYETAAWGNSNQEDFLNQVLVVETMLEPAPLMDTILDIEAQMGRVRTVKNAPRNIDIDILFYNRLILDTPSLVIPHPQIANRRFVLAPLNEIAPAMRHPVLLKTMHQLLAECPDKLGVKKF